MQFTRTDDEDAAADLRDRLSRELSEGHRVLWLTSGGSNIDLSVKLMDALDSELTANLSIMPVDERYGPLGHADSNWQQLLQAGFNPGPATVLPVLEDNLSFAQTLERYNQMAETALTENDVIIGQLGIGADGHIAGILPDSPTAGDSRELVAGYASRPHQRLTLTFAGLRKLSAAYVFAFGANKRTALLNLRDKNLQLTKQPAQILKELPEAYIYSDQIGDEA